MLTVVVSTWEDGVFDLEKTLRWQHPKVRYLVIHQTEKKGAHPGYMAGRPDVQVLSSNTRGLSVSRNLGLRNCKTRYALIADDDVEYIPEAMEELLGILERDQPDFGLFKIQTLPGEPEYKVYPRNRYEVQVLKHWVSSIEIVVDVDKVRGRDLLFDERFGLGAPLDRGEEEVFVHDLLASGLRGTFYPLYIVIHPYMSSGKVNRAIEEQWFVRGALDRRMGRQMSVYDIKAELQNNTVDLHLAELYYDRGREWVG